jgi:sugar/nucleoside kinase (ribokinase family)
MTSSRPAVLIVGSVAIDSVKTPLGEVDDVLGGAAVYSSVAASFFAPVGIVGVVGEDFPPEHLDFLRSRGVDLHGLQVQPGKTFRWKGFYDFDVNQAHSLETHLNVFEQFRPTIPDAYRDAPYVFLANIDPELQLEVLNQVRQPKLTLCDTMNFWIEGKRDALLRVLERVDVAFMNDAEARQLCGTFSLVKAARQIMSLGPKTVVIKKGEHGAVMFTEDSHFSAPSFPLEEVRDPTGAGDTFEGGFIGYVAMKDDIREANLRKAVVHGSVLASYNVEDFSLGRMRTLTRDEIEDRYQEFRRIAFFEALP